jgi:proteasome lid subunit RPN8/RPN11
MIPTLLIHRDVADILARHAAVAPNLECCGLLAGANGIITHAFPATNAAPNLATAYDVPVTELVRLMREIRQANLEFLGIYHSHPHTANEPSPTDIELAAYPDAAYIILSPRKDAPQPLRAFSIREGAVTELTVEVVGD